MLTIPSCILLAAACLIIFAANRPVQKRVQECENRMSGMICVAACLFGCVLRLWALRGLPEGISAEEALVGVQGKALWQTGAFYPDGVLTTMLRQWAGEHTGPLLAAITAPFVGLFGISPLTARLPLVLLSVAALPAVYSLGCVLSGKRAGRFLLVIYALCPYFVLGARMTCGANAALYMLPIAAALLVSGMKKPALLYAGMLVLALSAYTQRMMLIIAPLAVISAAVLFLIYGKKRRHATISSVLGIIVCLPAMLTVYVNISGLQEFMLFGSVQIPNYGMYADNLFAELAEKVTLSERIFESLRQFWRAVVGGLFQAVWTENIGASLFMPAGMLGLTVISIPLMILGAGVLLLRWIDGKKWDVQHIFPRMLMIVWFIIALLCIMIFGNDGSYKIGGAPDVFDHANLFFFAALLMTAGWRQMQRNSRMSTMLLGLLLTICFVGVGVHLFGGSYQMNANTYFAGFGDACVQAKEIQDRTETEILLTSAVYPHVQPEEAAEVMFLYASDADMREKQNVKVIYAGNVEQVEEERIYIAESSETSGWIWDEIDYKEFGNYVLISTVKE